MGIDITNVSYLSFRMAPFIIVCFFILQSLLNWDLKGIIYLAGLLFSSVIIVALNSLMKQMFPKLDGESIPNEKCSIISLGEGGSVLSTIPLSLAVYSYTFFYMLIFIFNLGNRTDNKGILGKTKLSAPDLNVAFKQNIPTLVIFPLLCILEIIWIMLNSCVHQPLYFITCSIVVSGICGTLWAIIITSLNLPDLMYLSKSGVEVCSRPSKTYFSCKPQIGSKKTTSTGSTS
jgi:hypothetical protein